MIRLSMETWEWFKFNVKSFIFLVFFFFSFFLYKLPMIAKGIGKNQFKRYLELFIDTIFLSLVSQIDLFLFPIIYTGG